MTESSSTEFQDLISDDNMRLAWKRLTYSMRREVKDWLGLQAYAPQLDAHIQILQDSMRSGYEPSDAYPFFKTKQDRSLRRFSFLTMDDRFVFQAICNVLIENSHDELMKLSESRRLYANIPTPPKDRNPYVFKRVFGNRFSKSEGSYDRFRGQVLRSRKEFREQHDNAWLVRTDVRSYFPTVDHSHLRALLESRGWLSDERSRQVLLDCLKKWEIESGKGIPIGYECSDYIGNLFLVPLDEALEDFTVHRYVDDIYIFVEDFECAKKAIYIVDQILDKLRLQRNTVKTEFLNLQELCEKDLKQRLTESLSLLAFEGSTEESETQRHRDLLALLHTEFGEDFEKLNLRARIANISIAAFVLYRLRIADFRIRRLAYHILDHHPDYAFHAMTYLFRVYENDPDFESKLSRMFDAGYEAQDVKANALKFLKLVDNGRVSNGYIANLLDFSGGNDWHLTALAMRDITESNASPRLSELLKKMVKHNNPFLSSYAANLIFAHSSINERVELVNELLVNKSDYVSKIGLYLAHRYQIEVNPSAVRSHLESLMDAERLEEKDFFHNTMKSLLNIQLSREFPIQEYFGNITKVNQVLRDIYLHREQGIEVFVFAVKKLLSAFCERLSSYGQPIHNELEDFLHEIKGKCADLERLKNGRQTDLLKKLRKTLGNQLNQIQFERGLRMRDKMFISYSVEDRPWREMLVTAIKSYFGQNPPLWYFEGNLEFSDSIEQEILHNRSITKVAILLTSNHYFASEPIMRLEYPYFIQQRNQNNLKILWIPCGPSPANMHGLGDVWTPAGIEPLTGKGEHGRKTAFDLAARKLSEFFNPNDSSAG